jgi:cysteinylglycine-S-conjugate dipeptidase
LAPGDSPSQAMSCLAAHLQAQVPWGATLTIEPLEYVQPFTAKRGSAFQLAKRALAEAWGTEAVEIGLGGSIACLSPLARAMPKADFVLTGVEDPAANIHAPNESVELGELRRACEAEIRLLSYLRHARGGDG